MPIVAIIFLVAFPPWDAIRAWIEPLPDTVREQIEDALDHGLDGIIVYVDQSGKIPAFYSAGWKDKVAQAPADPRALFKIASIHKLYIASAASKLSDDEQAVYSSIYDYAQRSKRLQGSERHAGDQLLRASRSIPRDIADYDYNNDSGCGAGR